MKFNQYFFFNELHTKKQFAGKHATTYELNLNLVNSYLFWYSFNTFSFKNLTKYNVSSPEQKVLTSNYINSGQLNLHIIYFVECP